MARKDSIHPNYRKVVVHDVDGSKFEIKTTYPKDIMVLNISSKNHPAWTSEAFVDSSVDQVRKFEKKFAGFNIGMKE